MNSIARNHPLFRIGEPDNYSPAFHSLDKSSDLLIARNVQDAFGNSYPSVVLGRRDVLPTPDGKVAFHSCAIVAESDPAGGHVAGTLGAFVFVRVIERAISEAGDAGYSHGWYSEVLEVPAMDIIPGTPAVGDVIFHHEHNTYPEREGYAFVRLMRPKDWDFTAGYAAGGA